MARSSYNDELMRADGRADAVNLRRICEIYRNYFRSFARDKEQFFENHADDIEAFYLTHSDPDLGLALVVLCASIYDDPEFLFFVAAGPLEDILRKPDQEMLDRVLAEACKNARFRWMLTGVYPHAIADKARPEIASVIGSLTEADPMPPRLP